MIKFLDFHFADSFVLINSKFEFNSVYLSAKPKAFFF